jgi:hypothetical protein
VALLLIGQIYPAVVQTAFTTPNAQTYELPYINREIAGTRAAYGLSNVTVSNFTGDQPLTLANVQNDQVTVNNLRLWDFPPLKDTYEQQQTIRTYYTFYDIGIDRYTINNQPTSLEISAREFDFVGSFTHEEIARANYRGAGGCGCDLDRVAHEAEQPSRRSD